MGEIATPAGGVVHLGEGVDPTDPATAWLIDWARARAHEHPDGVVIVGRCTPIPWRRRLWRSLRRSVGIG